MLDFVASNGKFYSEIILLKSNSFLGTQPVIMVFKKVGEFIGDSWEYPEHLRQKAKYYKIIDRRNEPF